MNCANAFPCYSQQEQSQRIYCGVSLNCQLQPVQKLYGIGSHQNCSSSVTASTQVCGHNNHAATPDHLKLRSIQTANAFMQHLVSSDFQ